MHRDMIILGIDPGLNVTGYGAITIGAGRIHVLAAGDIRPPRTHALAERLAFLHEALTALIARTHPHSVVLETVFTHERYANTSTLMGHARGMACLVAQQHHIPVIEYPPARVKQSVTGHGAASKDQVARMVSQWIGEREASWSFDATDALALALAHAHMQNRLQIADCRLRTVPGRQSKIQNQKSEISADVGVQK